MLRMFWYEIKMDFLRSIRYRFGMISDLLVYFALFTVFMVTDSGNSYAQTYHYGNYKELVLMLPGSMRSRQFPMSRDRCRAS